MTPKVRSRRLAPKTLARRIAKLALEKMGEDVQILDLTALSAACDYFVLCSCGSEQQVLAVADHIETTLRGQGQAPWHVEGRAFRRWVLLDFVDVVAHVFHKETREYYRLESLWGDAKVTRVALKKPARRSEG